MLGWILNGTYLLVLIVLGPFLLWRRFCQKKSLGGFMTKFFGLAPLCRSEKPRVWLHAVSVGEVLLLRTLLAGLRQRHPQYEYVISVSTTTGFDVARRTYGDLLVFWFPFDFTWAVRRALRRIKPSLVILAELELWPNFIHQAKRLGAKVVVVNGRLSEKSFNGYKRVKAAIRPALQMIDLFAVQHQEYADRLKVLGVAEEKLAITGSVKFDGAIANRQHPKTIQLRQLFQLSEEDLVWLVGSTQDPEEAWALEIYQKLKPQFAKLRLVLVPRHQERFEDVAKLLEASGLPIVRKSELKEGQVISDRAILLIDTLGDLSAAWGLAIVGFVGGSFNDRGGQNMVEPAAFGVAVTFGPNTWNFKQVVERLLLEEAAVRVTSKEQWQSVTEELLRNEAKRTALGQAAQRFVLSQQGATEKTLALFAQYLTPIQNDTARRRVA